MNFLKTILNILKAIMGLPKRLIDLLASIIVELRRVEWLSLGKLTKTTLLVLFYATFIGVTLYMVDRFFEIIIVEKILNLTK